MTELKSWNDVETKLKGPKTVIVICYADWCGHCQSKQAMWKDFAKQLKGKVDVYKIESENSKGHVSSFPTYKVKKTGGNVEEKSSGAETVSELKNDLLGETLGGKRRRTVRLVRGRRKTAKRAFRFNIPLA